MTYSSWIDTSLVRYFPTSPARTLRPPTLHVARGESIAFQVVLRHRADGPATYRVDTTTLKGIAARVRRIGYVPVPHHTTETPAEELDGRGFIPGLVPDPLFEEHHALVGRDETHAFHVKCRIAGNTSPGRRLLRVQVTPEKGHGPPIRHTVPLVVHPTRLRKRRGLAVTNWFYNDAVLDHHDCAAFDKRYWQLLPAYFRNMVEHGQDTIYIPAFTPSLDGVKRPTQLVRVTETAPGKYHFDWRDVRRYVELARRCGFKHFEWCHLFTQWGVKHALRIYHGQGTDERLLWKPTTSATSGIYRNFLSQYLPALHAFLGKHKLLKQSFFHVSDEPHGEHKANYLKARRMLSELAPWMRVMDALSDLDYALEGVTDMPAPGTESALAFKAAGIPSWTYYCCGQRGGLSQRLMDTPHVKNRMLGWQLYRHGFLGFLHWGYNYWYRSQTREKINPFQVSNGDAWTKGWTWGDPFIVYPGPDGPIDSLRGEAFAEGLQDYALLETLGVDPEGRLLSPLVDMKHYPKSNQWLLNARKRLLSRR